MHFYIIDGNFYLGRWQHMPPPWQVPSSLSDLCMDSIIIPNFKYQAASAVFTVLPLFFLFQDAEGFALCGLCSTPCAMPFAIFCREGQLFYG